MIRAYMPCHTWKTGRHFFKQAKRCCTNPHLYISLLFLSVLSLYDVLALISYPSASLWIHTYTHIYLYERPCLKYTHSTSGRQAIIMTGKRPAKKDCSNTESHPYFQLQENECNINIYLHNTNHPFSVPTTVTQLSHCFLNNGPGRWVRLVLF